MREKTGRFYANKNKIETSKSGSLKFNKQGLEKLSLDREAMTILRELEEAGYESWIVGGAVRDAGLGLAIHDIDINTSAEPDEIEAVFSEYKTLDVGKRYGTIRVIIDRHIYEVTSFRSDGHYSDGRRPDEVAFGKSIIEDLKRRDFTMNAMAWHPGRGLFDPFEGEKDLERARLKAVGEASERIAEDGLRMLRAVRFAARFNLKLDDDLFKAIELSAKMLGNLANERIFDEIDRMLTSERAGYAVEMLLACGLFNVIFPDLNFSKGDCLLLDYLDKLHPVRWAGLFHAKGEGAPEYAKKSLRKLKASRDLEKNACLLLGSLNEDIPKSLADTRRFMRSYKGMHWLVYAFKMTIYEWENGILGEDFAPHKADSAIIEPVNNDFASDIKDSQKEILKRFKIWHRNMMTVIDEDLPVFISDLDISGDDLIVAGYDRGKVIGRSLEFLLQAVIEEKVLNKRPDLLAYLDRELKK